MDHARIKIAQNSLLMAVLALMSFCACNDKSPMTCEELAQEYTKFEEQNNGCSVNEDCTAWKTSRVAGRNCYLIINASTDPEQVAALNDQYRECSSGCLISTCPCLPHLPVACENDRCTEAPLCGENPTRWVDEQWIDEQGRSCVCMLHGPQCEGP